MGRYIFVNGPANFSQRDLGVWMCWIQAPEGMRQFSQANRRMIADPDLNQPVDFGGCSSQQKIDVHRGVQHQRSADQGLIFRPRQFLLGPSPWADFVSLRFEPAKCCVEVRTQDQRSSEPSPCVARTAGRNRLQVPDATRRVPAVPYRN